jgi:hypothetical protein
MNPARNPLVLMIEIYHSLAFSFSPVLRKWGMGETIREYPNDLRSQGSLMGNKSGTVFGKACSINTDGYS